MNLSFQFLCALCFRKANNESLDPIQAQDRLKRFKLYTIKLAMKRVKYRLVVAVVFRQMASFFPYLFDE